MGPPSRCSTRHGGGVGPEEREAGESVGQEVGGALHHRRRLGRDAVPVDAVWGRRWRQDGGGDGIEEAGSCGALGFSFLFSLLCTGSGLTYDEDCRFNYQKYRDFCAKMPATYHQKQCVQMRVRCTGRKIEYNLLDVPLCNILLIQILQELEVRLQSISLSHKFWYYLYTHYKIG